MLLVIFQTFERQYSECLQWYVWCGKSNGICKCTLAFVVTRWGWASWYQMELGVEKYFTSLMQFTFRKQMTMALNINDPSNVVYVFYCDFQESWRQTILQGRRFLRTWRRGQTLYWPAAALRAVRVRWVTCQRWAAVLKSPAQDLRLAAQGSMNSQQNRVLLEEVVRTVLKISEVMSFWQLFIEAIVQTELCLDELFEV